LQKLQKNENFSIQFALPAHEHCPNYSDILYKFISLLRKKKKKKKNDILCRSKLMKGLYFVLCRLMHIWNVFLRGCCFTLIIFSFFIGREIFYFCVETYWIFSKFPNAMWYCIYSGIAQFFLNSFRNNHRLLFIICFYFKTVLNNVLRC